ncbi:MAG TPA: DUF2231 domain-containing protein [Acidobacteriota bacterium]|nr:DUF2231 domain-containing protein [Acidobacteriota bacterium]
MFDVTHLHPMMVHFPIALLFVGFLAELAGLILKKEFFSRMGLVLLVLGTAGIAAAYLSGHSAAEGLNEAGPLKMAIENHEDAALLTLWIMVMTQVARLALVFFKKYTGMVRWVPLVLFLVGVASLTRTGYYGGELVFKHAAGVQLSIGAFGADIQGADTEDDD